MYILGFPTDTDETINKTINYSKKLNTTYAQFSVWTPYPGTPVFSEYKDKINVEKYENFDQYQLVYNQSYLTKMKYENISQSIYSLLFKNKLVNEIYKVVYNSLMKLSIIILVIMKIQLLKK